MWRSKKHELVNCRSQYVNLNSKPFLRVSLPEDKLFTNSIVCFEIAVQGAGSGGSLSLSGIIISDLVTLKERGAYNGIIGM